MATDQQPNYTVYGDMLSGNCYKLKLLLRFLDIPHRWQHIDILAGETRSDSFLAINPNGRIPVLRFGDDDYLVESNAILNYLAQGTEYLPDDRWPRAQVLQWQFFEQYSHEPYIAVARFINVFQGMPGDRREEYERLQPKGHAALAVMERALGDGTFLVGNAPSIADISLYAYTHVADEGGFSLDSYPNIRAWCERIAALPGYVTMDRDNA